MSDLQPLARVDENGTIWFGASPEALTLLDQLEEAEAAKVAHAQESHAA